MTFDFVARLKQEARVTLTAVEETVLSLAERVNRKVQLLRLHWQASQIQGSITGLYRDLGRRLIGELAVRPSETGFSAAGFGRGLSMETQASLMAASHQVQSLKAQFSQIEIKIGAMKSELIREDISRFTRDLEVRGITLQYVGVRQSSALSGHRVQELATMTQVRVVALVRGPLVLGADSDDQLQPGDGLLLLGPPQTVTDAATALSTRRLRPRAETRSAH